MNSLALTEDTVCQPCEADTLREDELCREQKSLCAGLHAYQKMKERGEATSPALRWMIRRAIFPIADRISDDIYTPKRGPVRRGLGVLKTLMQCEHSDEETRCADLYLDAEKAAYLAFVKLITALIAPRRDKRTNLMLKRDSMGLLDAAEEIGFHIDRHVQDSLFEGSAPYNWQAAQERLKNTQKSYFRRRSIDGSARGTAKWAASVGRDDVAANLNWQLDRSRRQDLGLYLLDVILSTGLVRQTYERYRGSKKHRLMVYLADETKQKFSELHELFELARPKKRPMVTAPRNWSVQSDGSVTGGYLLDAMRLNLVKNSDTFDDVSALNLDEVLRPLNVLQRVPWRVNQAVYEAMFTAWKNGKSDREGNVGRVPPRYKPEPVFPEVLPRLAAELRDRGLRTHEERKQHSPEYREIMRRRREIHDADAELGADMYRMQYRMLEAESLRDYERWFHAWSLDFRSRAYPASTLLSPQGDDFDRALIEFADGRRMGNDPVAADWLAIHGANLYGIDKVPFVDRIAWVKDYTEQIIASADDPLHETFWQDADGGDGAWRFLAFAMEWKSFVENGANHITHLPIAMDGSNNGLQHLSALLGDDESARKTNVLPADSPNDIYQDVADAVTDKLQERAKRDLLAREWLTAGVTRKLMKQPVMTTVYGSTTYGMTDQIETTLADLDKAAAGRHYLPHVAAEVDNHKAAVYLSKLVSEAIAEQVPAAAQALRFFREVANVVTSFTLPEPVRNSWALPIQWTAPTGLPVVQRAITDETMRKRVMLDGRSVKLRIRDWRKPSKADKKRAANSLAANFVHAMDSAHMLRTTEAAEENGIANLSMIHDSFGTLAPDAQKLAELTRVEFAVLYAGSMDWMEGFRAEIADALVEAGGEETAAQLPKVPERGNLTVSEVLKSPYFFA